MALQKHRDIFLATCLLESIEDENYRNTQKLLLEHHANPNLLIPECNIAPIHYAAGMENTEFAEALMKLILKNNGDPNVQTIEGETPLHIAVIWNRTLIVEMLLDHGADLSITDNDNNTPISHALIEEHYNLIPIFQNYVFEEKLQKKLDARYAENRNERLLNKRLDTVMKSFHQLDMTQNSDNDKLLTPNRTNFNFNEASPFLVNVNCRRRRRPKYVNVETVKLTECANEQANDDNVIVISDSDDNDATTDQKNKKKSFVKNLFELTEENVEKHLSTIVKRSRKDSLIHLWRNRVNESRQRTSFLPINEDEFEAFLSDNIGEVESVKSSQKSLETVIPFKSTCYRQCTETEESFITAIDEHELATVEKNLSNINLKKTSDVVFQTLELYEHFDPENNILFYENKLLANPVTAVVTEKIKHQDDINLNTSSESGTVTDLPTDYDTDDLRKELKAFGDVPGPITKNTKRLYLRRLVRYHRSRRPQESTQHSKQKTKCNFSIELQKTMKREIDSLDFINIEYSLLERQMISGFQSMKNMREGNLKKSFNYLLIDPRIAENILADSQVFPTSELWCRFSRAIFYVGKGKSSRPFQHLYDAIKIYRDNSLNVEKMPESLKLARIIDIWKSNKGVICLPVFHNIIPVEAYTREAAIIDCLGIENLTNIKRGDYYGIAKSWSMRDRKKLGVLLLYKALQVFMIEGESQLRPNDIK